MNKVFAVAVVAVGLVAASTSRADTDVFGIQQQIDGAYALRQTTTEQYSPVRGESVLTRPRPDFDAIPLSVGSFNLFPSLDFGVTHPL